MSRLPLPERRGLLQLTAALSLLALWPSAGASRAPDSDGLSLAVTVQPLRPDVGEPARLILQVSDTTGALPFSGLSPRAWATRRDTRGAAPCAELHQAQFRGDLAGRSLDLGAPQQLRLGERGELLVLGPSLGVQDAQVLTRPPLPGPATSMLLSPDQRRLLLTLPALDLLAILDTEDWQTLALLPLPSPKQLRVQPDGATAWVSWGDGEQAGLAALDPELGQERLRLPLPGLPADFDISADSARLFALVAEQLFVVDIPRMELVARLSVGPGARWVRWSELAQAALVSREDGALLLVDGTSLTVRSQAMVGGQGPAQLLEGGRFVRLISPSGEPVTVDLATGQVTEPRAELSPEAQPEQATALELDRRMRERAPGRYETQIWLPQPGVYDLLLSLDALDAIACRSIRVGPGRKGEYTAQDNSARTPEEP